MTIQLTIHISQMTIQLTIHVANDYSIDLTRSKMTIQSTIYIDK